MEQAIWLFSAVLIAGSIVGAALVFTRRRQAADGALSMALGDLAQTQQTLFGRMAEISGKVSQISTDQTSRQAALEKKLDDRLDAVGKRVGESLTDQGTRTAESLQQLQERLATIDAAQKNLTDLSSQVVTLQDILANKQARGAFGQAQMEHIIRDTLPGGTYAFNAPLSNGTRPDCKIILPNSSAAIIIDAKFPRESFDALGNAQGAEAKRAAEVRVRAEVRKHVDDIASKYLIPGETQDPAIMFVPAESLYCMIFAEFFDIIQHAQRKRVVIVSPNMLMLAVNTMRAMMRDQKMREQAHLIQEEVSKLLEDVQNLSERTANLRRHFGQSEEDIRKIEISADKIGKRGERIVAVEIGAEEKVPVIEEPTLPLLSQARG
jgi:DNA recombination protein RmuC